MAEYISREKLIDKLKMWLAELEAEKNKGYSDELYENKGAREAVECCIAEIETLSAADVQPIKKGHWYHNTSKYISELDAYFIQACCSCCGKYSDRVDSYSQQMSNESCSHCGARMDGDTE